MGANWRAVIAMSVAVGLSACVEDGQTKSQTSDAPRAEGQAGNSAPRVSGIPSTWATAGNVWSFQVHATDADGDTLTFTATGLPAWASINSQTGLISGTPAATDAGVTADIFVSVSDGRTSSSLPAFRVSIESAPQTGSTPPATSPSTPQTSGNSAPSISGVAATSVMAGSNYSFKPVATDPEGSALKFSISNKPSWAAFSTVTGTLSGKPTSSQTGTFGNIVISVSDGSLAASLPPFSITVTPAPNQAPTISGSPGTTVATGANYTFTPAASDPDGDALAFSISGKPSWASFSTSTGALTGTAQAGTYSNIVISVSDGNSTRSLPAFTVTVNAVSTGQAALTWAAPTENADGSSLTDLAGYRIYHGTTADTFGEIIEITGSNSTSYTFTQLAKGTHYFAIASFNSSGTESEKSVVGSKTIL